jgi:hypothetical protein
MFHLNQLGWHNFQQLCHTILREILGQTVESFLDSNDAGRDGAYAGTWKKILGEDLSGKFVFQCKFTEKESYNLVPSDISEELPKIKKLVKKKLCDCYILITNAGLSGSTEIQIKSAVMTAGAKTFKVFSSNWIIAQIKESSKLRMLVPRIYGLGDLSQILDGRALDQAKTMLQSLSEDISKVVKTSTYEKAANALEEHGFVLLVGEPAAGKTTIASLLAMASLDRHQAYSVKVDNAHELKQHWNPHEPYRFYWIDDAFGVNQYESQLTKDWNHIFPQIRTMIDNGAKIVMTSRDYIYKRARMDLKESAFPLLHESQVVIDVKDLTKNERKQILYNHLKLGRQSKDFIRNIKPFLDMVSEMKEFVPETARRISDPAFTRNFILSEYAIRDFVTNQKDFLRETIFTLDYDSKAALAMIYMHSGSLNSPVDFSKENKLTLEKMSSSVGGCLGALATLESSFVQFHHTENDSFYRFKHPTIGDAFSSLLAESQELLEVYIAGTNVRDLMRQITCGNVEVKESVVIPKKYFDVVIHKIDEYSLSAKDMGKFIQREANDRILTFLSYRCSTEFLNLYISYHPELLAHVSHPGLYLSADNRVDLAIRLQKIGIFPEEYRKTFVEIIVKYAKGAHDFYVFTNGPLQAILTASERDDLFGWIEEEVLYVDLGLSYLRDQFVKNWVKSFETAENYMENYLELLNFLLNKYEINKDIVWEIENEISETKQWITDQEAEYTSEGNKSWDNENLADESTHSERSIFDDIDA